jgi:2-polyprenyl-6-methoxyphenol hydroxylase-like FAD-dependent oxidoreductase
MTRVVIIGGSMAGLAAGVALHHLGFDVSVHERAGEELASRGAGIATHDVLYAALEDVGVTLRENMGVRADGRTLLDRAGHTVHTHEMPQTMTSWGLMYRFLRAQFPDARFHNGHTFSALQQENGKVRVRFVHGEEIVADWVIGADGTRSAVRACVAPQATLNDCGYFSWRGLTEESAIPAEVLRTLAYRMTLSLTPGGHWLGYLVAGRNDDLRPGHRWFNWVWYRTADPASLADHLTDTAGQHHPQGIPPPLIRGDRVAAMRDEALALLPPQAQAVVAATPTPFLQPIVDLAAERLVFDRVCLIGDAAITARPHIGLGVSKAVEDAVALAHALAGNADALAVWETERLRYGNAAFAFSRNLGSYIGPAPSTEAQREKAAWHQRPEIFLSATAPANPGPWLGL